MWREVLTAVWLLPMSITDAKSRRVPVWMLWCGAAAAAVELLYEGLCGGLDVWNICRALVPGIVLLAVAYVTGKAGMADGMILMPLGILSGYERCLAASLGGLFLLSFFCGILLVLRRVKRDTQIPYIPFLTLGWLIVLCGKEGVF